MFLLYVGLFNLRGSDISYNPVFMSYATVTLDGARWRLNNLLSWKIYLYTTAPEIKMSSSQQNIADVASKISENWQTAFTWAIQLIFLTVVIMDSAKSHQQLPSVDMNFRDCTLNLASNFISASLLVLTETLEFKHLPRNSIK